jgi:hypothetical protein
VFCKYLGLLGMTGNRNFLKRNPIVSLLHAHEDSVTQFVCCLLFSASAINCPSTRLPLFYLQISGWIGRLEALVYYTVQFCSLGILFVKRPVNRRVAANLTPQLTKQVDFPF